MTDNRPAGPVDVHAHFVPDAYRTALLAAGHDRPDGMPEVPAWSADEHVAMMDRLGIATALLSISSPGVHLGDGATAIDLAREVNDAGAATVAAHPGRFGLLASLPVPDVDAAIAEVGRCVDELHVDGFVLLTNADGTYLGDPAYAPLWAELDRRHARVFLHPTSPPCWEATSLGRPRPMVEFLFDTTRAVVDLILAGVVAAHRDVAFVVPHCGATLATVADRVSVFSLLLDVDPDVDVYADLRRLHYDLAGFPLPRQLDALRSLVDADHLHYGSDYPFTPEFAAAGALDRLAEHGVLATLRANTERLFPTLL